jgi:hypothetical protein
VRGRDVQENEFISARFVIESRLLHRVARIDEVDEVDAFYDAALVDVETRDDAFS